MRGKIIFPIPCLLTLATLVSTFFQPCSPMSTVVVDGFAEWKASTLHVDDSLVFEHVQNLYLFHNRRAFDLCIFAQATLIYDGDSNSSSTRFTWHPSRPGHYYFSTRDGSPRSCEGGEKIPVRVITPDLSPAPPPTAGGDLPAFPSPDRLSSSPSLAPEASPLLPGEASPPGSAGGGIPFISSNPAVPLPTGETDTATIRPLPTPGDQTQQVVGSGPSHRIQVALFMCVMMSSSALLLWL